MRRRTYPRQEKQTSIEVKKYSSMLGTRVPLAALIQTLKAAEYLNFRHAANALGVSQSSVSARVKALEEDLGILLFERHARGVRLTEAGRHFVERVTTGIDHLDHAIRTAGMVARGEQGQLRVGIHALIPGSFLAILIERYRELRAGIDVEIIEDTARANVMRLRANRLDLTFVAGAPDLPDCRSRPIWSERLLAAMPSRHPLSDKAGVNWADLSGDTFIVRQDGTGPQVHDHIVQRLAGGYSDLSILRFDVERGTLLTMVAQGYGVTIVGEATSKMYSPGVTYLPILDEPAPVAFSAIWSPHNRSAALRSLLNLAAQMSRRGVPSHMGAQLDQPTTISVT